LWSGGAGVLGGDAEVGEELLLALVEAVVVDALGEQPSGGVWGEPGEA
jgi:hypothetical protein